MRAASASVTHVTLPITLFTLIKGTRDRQLYQAFIAAPRDDNSGTSKAPEK